jgi:ribose 5-phosphate isomerase A
VKKLGKFPIPVEIVRFGAVSTQRMIEALASDIGCNGEVTMRLGSDGKAFVTDSGHLILDCAYGVLPDAQMFDDVLRQIPGVVDNGLFLGIADLVIIAGKDGVTVLEAETFDLDAEEA